MGQNRLALLVALLVSASSAHAQRITPTVCASLNVVFPRQNDSVKTVRTTTCRDTVIAFSPIPPIPPPVDTTHPPIPPDTTTPPSGGTKPDTLGFGTIFRGNPFNLQHDGNVTVLDANSARITYPAGFGGGNSPGQAYRSFSSVARVYFAGYFRWSTNFVGHSTSINKVLFGYIGGSNDVFLMACGKGSGTLVPAFGLQNLTASYQGVNSCSSPMNATAVQILPNVAGNTNVTLARGAWHFIECQLSANGNADMWVNGKHVLHYTGIPWRSGSWSELNWNPTWGGSGGTTPTMMLDGGTFTWTGK